MMHYRPNEVRYARMQVTVFIMICYESVQLI
jgi:hypothetical protein